MAYEHGPRTSWGTDSVGCGSPTCYNCYPSAQYETERLTFVREYYEALSADRGIPVFYALAQTAEAVRERYRLTEAQAARLALQALPEFEVSA